MEKWTLTIALMLSQAGLDVHLAGDMPGNLTGYDLLVIHAYWAVEPRHVALVEAFIASGGGVVILAGVPEFFRCWCKDWWTYGCPTDSASQNLKEIFGWDCGYVNTGGCAVVTVNHPFDLPLLVGDTLVEGAGDSSAALRDLAEGARIVAAWEQGYTFAYSYEHGQGRVYYQAKWEILGRP